MKKMLLLAVIGLVGNAFASSNPIASVSQIPSDLVQSSSLPSKVVDSSVHGISSLPSELFNVITSPIRSSI